MRRLFDYVFPHVDVTSDRPVGYAYWGIVFLYAILLWVTLYSLDILHIETESGITKLAIFIVPGFLVSSLLPARFKAFIFILVFITSSIYAFEYFSGGLLLVCILLFYVILFHGLRWIWSAVLAIILLVMFVILRSDLLYLPRLNLVVPFLLSIVMFRVLILLYDSQYAALSKNHWINLAYLFSFPNLSFLFSPILDYRTFVKSYCEIPSLRLFHQSMVFISLGVLQLVIYKVVYALVYIPVSDVTDLPSLLLYLSVGYVTVLKLSGICTLFIGLIVAFGFNMPAPFGNFLLAHSFIDFWRKVNVYWRAFMMKIIYLPFFFAIRKKTKYAFSISIFFTFIASWLFHIYQRLGIAGSLSVSYNDFLFWLILGLLVTFTSKSSDEVASHPQVEGKSIPELFRESLGVIMVTFSMLFLWFLWKSDRLTDFFYVISKGMFVSWHQIVYLFVIMVIFVLVYTLGFYFINILTVKFRLNRLLIAAPYIFIMLLFLLAICKLKTDNILIAAIKQPVKLNQADIEKAETGYYESVLNVSSNWELNLKRAKRFDALDKVSVRTNDLLVNQFTSQANVSLNGYTIQTNSFGIRDKEYSKLKPDNCIRIAILGASYELGAGVNNHEIFESITEKRLNERLQADSVEILNFSMGGYTSVHELELLNAKVIMYKPDVVIVFAHTDELRRATGFFARYIKNGTNLKYEFLKKIKVNSGVKQFMSDFELKERLRPYMSQITMWTYQEMVSLCRLNNIQPVWIFLPTTNDIITQQKIDEVERPAIKAGFKVFTMKTVFLNVSPKDISISDTDPHPNKYGHFLLAEAFYNLLSDSNNHILNK